MNALHPLLATLLQILGWLALLTLIGSLIGRSIAVGMHDVDETNEINERT